MFLYKSIPSTTTNFEQEVYNHDHSAKVDKIEGYVMYYYILKLYFLKAFSELGCSLDVVVLVYHVYVRAL